MKMKKKLILTCIIFHWFNSGFPRILSVKEHINPQCVMFLRLHYYPYYEYNHLYLGYQFHYNGLIM